METERQTKGSKADENRLRVEDQNRLDEEEQKRLRRKPEAGFFF